MVTVNIEPKVWGGPFPNVSKVINLAIRIGHNNKG